MVIRVGGLVGHSGLGWAGRSIECSGCVFRGSVGVLGLVHLVAGQGDGDKTRDPSPEPD
jgi:hypothetical protein